MAALSYVAYTVFGVTAVALSFAPLGVLGSALAIFLAFRANTSFARWGEAAQIWSNIISSSRTFARLICTFADSHRHTPLYNAETAEAFKRAMLYRHLAWVNALRIQLRKQYDWGEAWRFLNDGDRHIVAAKENKTSYLLKLQGEQIYSAMANGTLQGFDSFQLEGQLAQLSTHQAACERIKAAIGEGMAGEKRIRAVLDPYNPTGSTNHVNFTTSKETRWKTDPRRCHVNWAVCDLDWEAELCRVVEAHRSADARSPVSSGRSPWPSAPRASSSS